MFNCSVLKGRGTVTHDPSFSRFFAALLAREPLAVPALYEEQVVHQGFFLLQHSSLVAKENKSSLLLLPSSLIDLQQPMLTLAHSASLPWHAKSAWQPGSWPPFSTAGSANFVFTDASATLVQRCLSISTQLHCCSHGSTFFSPLTFFCPLPPACTIGTQLRVSHFTLLTRSGG